MANGETALITGASSGIGLELARLFAADGSRLILVARSADKLEKLADELRQNHRAEVTVLPADLADPTAPKMIFDRLTAEGVTVDVVINNAGFGTLGAVADLSVEQQLEMIQVNVVALTQLTRLFLPNMIAKNCGGVLNVGSTAGFQPGPNMAVYYATKAFVLSFTEALAEELSQTNIHVTCLTPGPTATGFGNRSGMNDSIVFKLGTMTARAVAEQGYQGFRRRKPLVITGNLNRLGAFSVRLAPRSLVRKLVKRLQS